MAAAIPLPRTVDRYELLEELGSGAFATVYRGRHALTEQPVAIKILRPEAAAAEVDRWLNEARAMAAVDHPNVVRVLDCGRAKTGEAFLVMELAAGDTLAGLVDGPHPIPIAHAVRLARQILEGLEAVHRRGIVHRDVKPPNVLVTHDGNGDPVAKLLDFGVSKVTSGALGSATLPGTAIGTPGYMAPELFGDAANADARADVYAVAATLFEMLTRRTPFQCATYEDYVVQVRTLRAPPVRSLAPHVPAPLGDVIDRGLARDRDARWPTARAFADALQGAASASIAPGRPELDATIHARVSAPPMSPPLTPTSPPLTPTSPPLTPVRVSAPPTTLAAAHHGAPLALPEGHDRTLTSRSSAPPSARRSPLPRWVVIVAASAIALALLSGAFGITLALVRPSSGDDMSIRAAREPKQSDPTEWNAERAVGTAPDPNELAPAPSASTSASAVATAVRVPAPGAGTVAAVASASAQTKVLAVPHDQGVGMVIAESTGARPSTAAFAGFAHGAASHLQSCRPASGASTTVLVELMMHTDEGTIAMAHPHPRSPGDKATQTCVADGLKASSDAGVRMVGGAILSVRVTLDPK